MINSSKEFRQVIHERTDFKESARITFKDGRILDLQDDDFTVSGNTVSDSAGSSSFPLGVAVGRVIQLQIFNDNDRLSSYDFYGAVIDLRLSLELSNGPEILNFGTYTVIEPETYGETVTIQAMDNMYKADKDYSTSLNFPVSLRTAVLDSAQTCGVTLLTTTFKNDDFMIRQVPEGITHRTFLAMAAMIACGYARIDYNGRLCIESYDFSAFNEGIADLDGGIFDGNTPYSSGDDADGGAFNPWNTGYEYDSGIFSQMDNYHVFFEFGTLTVSTDDVVITGIETTVDETRYLSGSEGYTLNIENQLISGQEQAALDLIGKSIIGIRFRPFEGDHIAYPLAEFGDLAYVIDRKNNAYQTVLTDINFEWNNVTTLKCSADSPLRNSSRYNSQLTQAIVTARKDAEKQLSNYDMAVKDMTSIMANSLGLFESYEETENGGRIAYQHNKPNREDSDIIWKKSEQGFQVSTDGGKTWNAGMTADGRAVVNVLSAVGILFDWARGGTLALGGKDNGNGLLVLYDDDGNETAVFSNGGANFYGRIRVWESNNTIGEMSALTPNGLSFVTYPEEGPSGYERASISIAEVDKSFRISMSNDIEKMGWYKEYDHAMYPILTYSASDDSFDGYGRTFKNVNFSNASINSIYNSAGDVGVSSSLNFSSPSDNNRQIKGALLNDVDIGNINGTYSGTIKFRIPSDDGLRWYQCIVVKNGLITGQYTTF